MNIPPVITNGLNTIKAMPKGEIAAKAAGVAGICIAVRDAHHWGKYVSKERRNNANAKAGLEYFNNTQYLNNRSRTTSKLKNKIFKWELGETIRGSFNAAVGYVSGFTSQLFREGLTVAGSIAALALTGKNAMVGGAVIAVSALNGIFRNVFSHKNSKI